MNAEKPTLYILCGLPFSGKSRLARELSQRFGFPIVSIDTIRENRGFSWEENEKVTIEDWKSIFEESYQVTLSLLRSGKNVLYDSANQDRVSRDKLRSLVAEGGFPTKVIFLDVSERDCCRIAV